MLCGYPGNQLLFHVPPMLEMFSRTQRADYFADPVFQNLYRPIIQMVSMVICDDEIIYVRHVFGLVNVCPLKRSVDE